MPESKTPKEKELSPQNVWPYYDSLSFDEMYEMENLAMDTVCEQGTLERLKKELSLKKASGEDGIDELAMQIIEQEVKVKELKEKIREMKKRIEIRDWEEYMEELRKEARKLIDSL